MIVHDIGDARALRVSVRLRTYQVAVTPVTEWSGHLEVTEMMIGRVFIDKCEPPQPDR